MIANKSQLKCAQHCDILHNDNIHNDTPQNDTQH
jgi:hypothetical protein